MPTLNTNRRVLVTGGAGFIGSHTVDLLLASGFEVFVADNFAHYGGGRRDLIPPEVPLYEVDVSAPVFEHLIADIRPHGVIHLAAQASVKLSTEDPLLDLHVNGAGIVRLLRACAASGVQHVVFASSGSTYNDVPGPIDERTPQDPESPYGVTKLLGELYCRYWRTCGLSSTILRYGNVYGPRQDPSNESGVIATFVRRMLDRQPVRIDWDGEQQKDYVYVADVARANLLALTQRRNDAFVIASGVGTSVHAIYHTIAAELGYEVPIVRAPRRPGDVYRAVFDCRHAREVLGWTATVDLREGVRRTIAAFRAES